MTDPRAGGRGSGRRRVGRTVVGIAVVVAVASIVAACVVLLDSSGSGSGSADGRPATSVGSPNSTGPSDGSEPSGSSSSAGPASLMEGVCEGAPEITDAGRIEPAVINEASGLVASWDNTGDGADGPWFTHNDSGGVAAVYAIDGRGRLLATVTLTGAEARDWEGVAVGPPAAAGGPPQLYVGDIGNNKVMSGDPRARTTVRVYRADEPRVPATPPPDGTPAPTLAVRVSTFTLRYPGQPYDAESMVVDPVSGDLFLITKDWARTGTSKVFRAPHAAAIAGGSTVQLQPAGEVRLEPGTLVTAADVTRDGSLVVLRSYGAVDLYRRPEGQDLSAAFTGTPCGGPVPGELQGESVAFAPDGGSYLTVSEGEHPMLHRTSP